LSVVADDPLVVGTNVAMSAPLPVGFVDVTCRVVAVIDEANRYGFAYGTLPVHPETGEEAFMIVRDDKRVRSMFRRSLHHGTHWCALFRLLGIVLRPCSAEVPLSDDKARRGLTPNGRYGRVDQWVVNCRSWKSKCCVG
jgi:hypothetical protein